MPAQLGRLQQAHHHRGTLACQLTAQEQPVFTTQPPSAYFGECDRSFRRS
jgi:hypothetical protein